jgi:hypothetical protein
MNAVLETSLHSYSYIQHRVRSYIMQHFSRKPIILTTFNTLPSAVIRFIQA